ncbi:uncharacterized protein BX663DRAFT_507838 [Cokeromyces recurvatus]|uniref:uncharacterized protein n=1 Tax=Cokeromyces recurvatus TaxID=90255 RepID=UPI00221E54B4|nr:uncharacterized protein BX663DRAFT_507838 [Cokeromyces recurvatus]KAI7903204.1 hypothetical protein BX663DRAFT_507838 [Cokeromyces recurvatus]
MTTAIATATATTSETSAAEKERKKDKKKKKKKKKKHHHKKKNHKGTIHNNDIITTIISMTSTGAVIIPTESTKIPNLSMTTRTLSLSPSSSKASTTTTTLSPKIKTRKHRSHSTQQYEQFIYTSSITNIPTTTTTETSLYSSATMTRSNIRDLPSHTSHDNDNIHYQAAHMNVVNHVLGLALGIGFGGLSLLILSALFIYNYRKRKAAGHDSNNTMDQKGVFFTEKPSMFNSNNNKARVTANDTTQADDDIQTKWRPQSFANVVANIISTLPSAITRETLSIERNIH